MNTPCHRWTHTHIDRDAHNKWGQIVTYADTHTQSQLQHISSLSFCVWVSSDRFDGIVSLSKAALRGEAAISNQQPCWQETCLNTHSSHMQSQPEYERIFTAAYFQGRSSEREASLAHRKSSELSKDLFGRGDPRVNVYILPEISYWIRPWQQWVNVHRNGFWHDGTWRLLILKTSRICPKHMRCNLISQLWHTGPGKMWCSDQTLPYEHAAMSL